MPHIHESLLQHLFRALPAVQYTESNAQQMRAGCAVHPLERRAIPQRDARQQSGKIFVDWHGGATEGASVDRRCKRHKTASPRFSRASPRARGGLTQNAPGSQSHQISVSIRDEIPRWRGHGLADEPYLRLCFTHYGRKNRRHRTLLIAQV